jgi:aldehyde dehydrogenase (NAD+)
LLAKLARSVAVHATELARLASRCTGRPLKQGRADATALASPPFDDELDALRIANGTADGLVAGVWTGDGSRQFLLARKLKSGQAFINDYGASGGIELPFGDRGASGYGCDKGFEAPLGFTARKTIAIEHG